MELLSEGNNELGRISQGSMASQELERVIENGAKSFLVLLNEEVEF